MHDRRQLGRCWLGVLPKNRVDDTASRVQRLVQESIDRALDVTSEVTPYPEAMKTGAMAEGGGGRVDERTSDRA